MSTTDEVDSHNWSDEDESKDELERKNTTGEDSEATESDSDEDTDQGKFIDGVDNGNHIDQKKGKRAKRKRRMFDFFVG